MLLRQMTKLRAGFFIALLNSFCLTICQAGEALGPMPILGNDPPAISVSPGDNIAALVNANPGGTTFVLNAGTYRLQSIQPKDNDVFMGNGAVVLNGSKILSFQAGPAGSGVWLAKVKASTFFDGSCQATNPLCGYTQDLFVDNKLQTPVASLQALSTGSWYFDRINNVVYLPLNPNGHVVELGMTSTAFYGTATGVHISGITITKYACSAQQGAIGNHRENTAWVVDHVQVQWNHGAGVELGAGSVLSNSLIAHNGQLGVAFGGSNGQVLNNEIAYNNYAGFNGGWEAGGSKFAETTNLVVRSNYVHDNLGAGLWADINNVHPLFEKNTSVNNQGTGLSVEISYNPIIRDNVIGNNGNGPVVWMWNSQIQIQNTSGADVYNNKVTVPPGKWWGNGIGMINQNRGAGILGPWVAANNYIHNNTIIYMGPTGCTGLVDDTKTDGVNASNNRLDYNTYIVQDGGATHWTWFGGMSWADFQAAGHEVHGKLVLQNVITVAKSGTGSGSITSTPSGLNCGSSCSTAFPPKSQVILNAVPKSGSVFAGWIGACQGSGVCALTIHGSQNLGAVFNLITYPLTVKVQGHGFGMVFGQGIDCGVEANQCGETLQTGSAIKLTAVAGNGSVFGGWSGACSGKSTMCSLTIKSNTDVSAAFLPQSKVQ